MDDITCSNHEQDKLILYRELNPGPWTKENNATSSHSGNADIGFNLTRKVLVFQRTFMCLKF